MAARRDQDGGADADPDEAQRTTANLIVAIVCLVLLGAGLFVVESLHRASKVQDCLEAGRRNCAAASTR
ncbi:hypothetical protein ABEG18_23060 [Alsobacter sp. KACC 23698]|uniref:Uncharacterized protein n=1 Tax=Alsobacter sp. KACC 23698 TaxID=3149229 RepID=A0AAU7JEB6_9HYPH